MKSFPLSVSVYASCFKAVGCVPEKRDPVLKKCLNVLEGLESVQECS